MGEGVSAVAGAEGEGVPDTSPLNVRNTSTVAKETALVFLTSLAAGSGSSRTLPWGSAFASFSCALPGLDCPS